MLVGCSWSPDGKSLCAVHAIDASKIISTASVIQRDKWTEDACLVGHHGVVECSVWGADAFSNALILFVL